MCQHFNSKNEEQNRWNLFETYSVKKLIRSASGVSPSKLTAKIHGCNLVIVRKLTWKLQTYTYYIYETNP